MRDAKTTAQLEAVKKEGVRIGVTVTPGVYINGKPYHSFKDPQWVIDAIEYSYETMPAKKKKK
jgi:protein-disulfide isomerase